MPNTYTAPGVYVEEKLSGAAPIAGAGTSTAGFLGIFSSAITTVTIPKPVKGYNPSGKTPPTTINLNDSDAAEQLAGRLLVEPISKLELDVNKLDANTLLIEETVGTLKTIANAGKITTDIKASGTVPVDELKVGDVLVQPIQGNTTTNPKIQQSFNIGHTIGDEGEKARIVEVVKASNVKTLNIRRVIPALGNAPGERAIQNTKDTFQEKVNQLDGLKSFTLETLISFDRQKITVGISPSQPLNTTLASAVVTHLLSLEKETVDVQVVKPYESISVPLKSISDSNPPQLCTNFNEFKKLIFRDFETTFAAKELPLNGFPEVNAKTTMTFTDQERLSCLMHAVYGFFNNGGTRCYVKLATNLDQALTDLQAIDEIAIVAVPGYGHDSSVRDKVTAHCEGGANQGNYYRFAIFDCAPGKGADASQVGVPPNTAYAAFYYPWIKVADPAVKTMDPTGDGLLAVPPSGHIAGVYARVDNLRGVHKAPANEVVFGALGVERNISKVDQQGLNPQGVNCIRDLNGNIRIWGARTVGGQANGEFTYISTRRLFLYLRHSIDMSTQWTVFEPNNSELWAKIRRNVTAFLTNTWRTGALFGTTPQEAFYVKCDAENNPPDLQNLGQVVIEIGVAVTKPAEFVVFRISQWAGPAA